MTNKKDVTAFLRKELMQAGYDAGTDEDIENLIFSEIVLGSGGKQLQSLDPIHKVLELVNEGSPMYIKGKEQGLIRITKNKASGELQAQTIGDSMKALEPKPEPGFFSRMLDSVVKLFGRRIEACKQWDEYRDSCAEQREIISSIEKIVVNRPKPTTLPQPVSIANAPQKSNEAIIASKSYIGKIPLDIQLAGDVNTLRTFIQNHNLTDKIKQSLTSRINTAEKIEKLANAPVTPNCPAPEEINGKIILSRVDQPERQSTINGCWSVSMQSLLAYHGVDLTQNEIRDYRPDCSIDPNSTYTLAGQELERKEIAHRMNADVQNEISDFSDLIHKTVKDVALHHVALNTGDRKSAFKEIVATALKEYNSPICMLHNGHYQTIVGIENDTLLLLDPQTQYKQTKGTITPTPVPVSKYTSSNETLMLDWLEKLSPDKQFAITESLKEHKTQNILSRHEGITTSYTDIKNNGLVVVHDVVYPKAYGSLQRLASQPSNENMNNLIEANGLTGKQAKVLTIEERKALENKFLKGIGSSTQSKPKITEASAHKPTLQFGKKTNAKKPPQSDKSL